MRIVSLLPSATEIICGLGLRDQLVGVTHECDYPPSVADLPKVTRTLIPHDATSGEIDGLVRERLKTNAALYSLDMPTLERLNPDLIVTQALCDVCAVAEDEVNAAACSLPGKPRVINLEPTCLDDVLECIRRVGSAANCAAVATDYVQSLQQRIDAVAKRSDTIATRPTVMLLEWIDPPFSAGHWSPELVSIAGGREVIGTAGQRSVTTPWESIVAGDPDVMMIACCGFGVDRTCEDLPILRSYPGWERLSCVQSGRVHIVDGSAYFSRPGPRLVDSLEILAHTLHPETHPLPDGLPAAFDVTMV
ncbi:cobalamin-binding protein [Aporhodopirellula aestuarii]|uniref:Cobalamin-binding protein n=1 Tax=Aporhodopirellula aestuarii TaxID=2950107 RepID=A0ABT0UAK1_9BACT|nr:cobalamin-binding protein [Aporhodopirellula aestuarii]MCM2374038.1 cobalamin-binding protein [Aporhodopirellula aestuarii]